MKRRNYLICSIIAMLSIVSYACETEYAICEGCGSSGDFCKGNIQRCAEDLNGKQVCKGVEWGSIGECMSCYNKNTDNSGAASLVCDGCTPNSYNELETEVCYKGDFKKFESKAISEGDTESSVILNYDSKNKGAPWELAFNKTVTKSGSFEYYNCHDADVFGDMKINGNAQKVVDEKSCCEENDYYIKRTGYKYYSVEVCRKVEFKERIEAVFWAYKYTSELNDLLIGKEDDLPYSFCHGGSIWAVNKNNDFSQASSMMYQKRMCPKGYSCAFNGICLSDSFKTTDLSGDDKFFVCEQAAGSQKGISIKYEHGNDSVGTCLSNMVLKQNIDGKWMDVTCNPNQKFKISEVRCAPSR